MIEQKLAPIEVVELKFDPAQSGAFEGYASVFNGVDSYGDTILPGAYAQTLENRQRPIAMRWNHHGPVIGKWVGIGEDGKGLHVRGQLTPGHSVAQDAYASMKHGAVNGLSIGFRIPSGGSEKDGKLRKLKKIDLVEISVVEEPADLSARIGDVKAWIDECDSLKDIEGRLRESFGYSRADACALVSRIKSLAHGERDAEAGVTNLAALFQSFRT